MEHNKDRRIQSAYTKYKNQNQILPLLSLHVENPQLAF